MAVVVALPFFKAYRFLILFGEPAASDTIRRLGGSGVGVHAIWSDPFNPGQLWIGKSHRRGDKTLRQLVTDANAGGKLSVFMLEDVGQAARRIDVTYASFDWSPFDLDAASDKTAVEWVALTGVRYGDPVDDAGPPIAAS